uniref:Uncharacterized protein n=1 Tax=Arundo donax TaxID=35708 RepID=A0A0A9AJF7_ARUDO
MIFCVRPAPQTGRSIHS